MGQIDKKTIRIEKAYEEYWASGHMLKDFRKAIMDNQPSLLDVAEEDMGRLLGKLADKFGGEFLRRKHLEPQKKAEGYNPKDIPQWVINTYHRYDLLSVRNPKVSDLAMFWEAIKENMPTPEPQQEDKKTRKGHIETMRSDDGFIMGHMFVYDDETQKKAEVCQHNKIVSAEAPFCKECNRFLLEPVEPQQESVKIIVKDVGGYKDIIQYDTEYKNMGPTLPTKTVKPQQEDMGKLNEMLAKHYEAEDKNIELLPMTYEIGCHQEGIIEKKPDWKNIIKNIENIGDHINTH